MPALDCDLAQRLDFHRITNQSVRLARDQDFAGLCGLLKPCSNVHRVTSDQPLTAGRVTRHHLAGRDPGPPGHRG